MSVILPVKTEVIDPMTGRKHIVNSGLHREWATDPNTGQLAAISEPFRMPAPPTAQQMAQLLANGDPVRTGANNQSMSFLREGAIPAPAARRQADTATRVSFGNATAVGDGV